MEVLELQLQSEIRNGRTQVGNLIAYYEQHVIAETGETDFIRVVYFRSNTVAVLLQDGTTQEETQEDSIDALIEYSTGIFRCQILEQTDISLFWDIFWSIYNQLKLKV